MPIFSRYIGIDYSGAQTPTTSLPGLRIYLATVDSSPTEIFPPPSPRKYWTRKGLAEWLIETLRQEVPTIVGIDHAFSFPMQYFEEYKIKPDWQTFLDDFQRHWPCADDHMYVDFVRDGIYGNGNARTGNSRWRRVTEARAGNAKSVFHFDVQGSVAKSTHAGIPWLRQMRTKLGKKVHFWPFDGWEYPNGTSVIAEVYPRLWKSGFPREGRNDHQHDAFSVAAWLAAGDRNGVLGSFLQSPLSLSDRRTAEVEGWILGVGG